MRSIFRPALAGLFFLLACEPTVDPEPVTFRLDADSQCTRTAGAEDCGLDIDPFGFETGRRLLDRSDDGERRFGICDVKA